MTTITERVEFASAAAHDFADAAMVQLFEMLSIHERTSDGTAAKQYSELLAALIQSATAVYVVERQCEAAARLEETVSMLVDSVKQVARAVEGLS